MMKASGMKTSVIALLCCALLPAAGITTASAAVMVQQDIPIEMPKPQPKFGLLIVTSLKGARVKITPLVRGRSYERVISDKGHPAIFQSLTPGSYIVSVTLEGYQSKEEKVSVPANRPTPLTLNLEQITYAATIQTNIRTGEI
jgi:hypothetical protein